MRTILAGFAGLILIAVLLASLFPAPPPPAPHTAGSLDPLFNPPPGFFLSDTAEAFRDRGVEVAVQEDGRIVTIGYRNNSRNEDLMLARLTEDGRPDPDFGSGGYVVYDGGGNDRGLGIAIQRDGKILATGFTTNGSHRDVLVLRFEKNGTPDRAFGDKGVVTFSSPGTLTDIGFGIAEDRDGGILVAGETSDGTSQDLLVLRRTAAGSPDPGFGSGGFITFGGSGMDRGFALALQPDGKILVAGSSTTGGREDLLLLRLHASGTRDLAFGNGGVVRHGAGGDGPGYGNWVSLQPDGKIVVTGAAYAGKASDLLLLRYNPDGSPDPRFGTGGVVLYGDAGDRDEYGYAHAIQRDGKIVVAGYAGNGTAEDLLVVRFTAAGEPDPGFGTAGAVLWNGPGGQRDYGQGVALQPDGRIVVTGFSHHAASEDLLVLRLLA